jgi:hypothetical protein
MSQFRPLPHWLSHYPLQFVEYFDFDGVYAGDTDAHYLSLGVSTWSDQDLSLKVWRRKDDKFLRQSEELPCHRPIDMVLLLLSVMDGEAVLPPGTFEHQSEELPIRSNPPNPRWVKSLEHYLEVKCGDETVGDMLKRRLATLHQKLDSLHKRGVI